MDQIYNIRPLKGFDTFKKVFANGKTRSTYKITLTIEFGTSDILHLGVGISKKRCKKAVVRNRIKRLLRVAIRELNEEKQLPENIKNITVFWKIAPKRASLIGLKEVKNELELLLEKFKS